jgi:hypothetical protein
MLFSCKDLIYLISVESALDHLRVGEISPVSLACQHLNHDQMVLHLSHLFPPISDTIGYYRSNLAQILCPAPNLSFIGNYSINNKADKTVTTLLRIPDFDSVVAIPREKWLGLLGTN